MYKRQLLLFGETLELRAEADVPRGMVLGGEPQDIPDNGTDFDRQQPVRLHARMLRATLRNPLGELSLGHTTTHVGMGIVDHDGDQPRFFGSPDRPSTYERLQLLSGRADAALRVFASGDILFEDGRFSLVEGDQLLRVALGTLYAPNRGSQLGLFARYESLQPKPAYGGTQSFVFDSSGRFRSKLAGSAGEVFGEYEAVYRLGDVSEASPQSGAGVQRATSSLAGAARLGVAFERVANHRRYGALVVSLEWGMASGDADPTDNELHRFVMNPNHAVGLILFSEVLRFKTSRAQALLANANAKAGRAPAEGVATRGGVAGASYLNPVLLLRPSPDLCLLYTSPSPRD